MLHLTANNAPGPDIHVINPKNGDRYSPNLYRWLNHRRGRQPLISLTRVFSDPGETLWIGYLDPEGDATFTFIGARLISVLCNGVSEHSGAYYGLADKLTCVEDFWPRYAAIGRCAIDTRHTMFFIGDDQRWTVEGNIRHCRWCGNHSQTFRRWTEVKRINYGEWLPRKSTPPPLAVAV